MSLAGTYNSKNGAEVHAENRHDYWYQLRQLQYDYLLELEKKKKTKRS
jgi:hypothetical protein